MFRQESARLCDMKPTRTLIVTLLASLALISPVAAAPPGHVNSVGLAPCVKLTCTATIKSDVVYDRPERIRIFAQSKTGASTKLLDVPVPPAGGADFTYTAVSPYKSNTFAYLTYVMVHGYWIKDNGRTTPR